MLRCLKLEERDLGSHVEADLSEVSDAAADAQPTVALQFEDSRGVSAILDGQQGRRKKRWLALAAGVWRLNFEPMRFDLPRIETNAESRRHRRC